MKTLYFYCDGSDELCYNATILIFQRLAPGEKFVQLESVAVQASKHPAQFHELIFKVDSVAQSSLITDCTTYQQIVRKMRDSRIMPFYRIEEHQYYRIKKKLLQICSTYPTVETKPLSNSNYCQHP